MYGIMFFVAKEHVKSFVLLLFYSMLATKNYWDYVDENLETFCEI